MPDIHSFEPIWENWVLDELDCYTRSRRKKQTES